MQLKIFKHSQPCLNLTLLPLIGVVITYILWCMASGISAFQFNLSLDRNHYLLIIAAVITGLSIYRVWKISKILLLFFVLTITYLNFYIFFISLNKLVLLFSFLYTIAAIIMYFIWLEELNDVVYNPGFTINDIFFKNSILFQVEIIQENNRVNGLITNMGEESVFVITDHNLLLDALKITLKVDFAGQSFTQPGLIVTNFGPGVGIKLKSDQKFTHNWFDFYSIIIDRSLAPLS